MHQKFALCLSFALINILYGSSIVVDDVADLDPSNLDINGFEISSSKAFQPKSDSLSSNSIVWNYDGNIDITGIFASYNSNLQDYDISQNSIVIQKGSFRGDVLRIISGYTVANRSNSIDNTIKASNISAYEIYGGYVDKEGNAIRNGVNLNNTTVATNILGGRTGSGEATENFIVIDQNTNILQNIYAGYVDKKGSATKNRVSMTGGIVSGDILGGRSEEGTASKNEIKIVNADVRGNVFGGYLLKNGNSGNNIVATHSANIGENVISGRTYNGNTHGNSVVVNQNSTIGNSVYGGYTDNNGNSIGNTISANEALVLENLIGGRTKNGNSNENEVSVNNTTVNIDVFGGYVFENGEAFKNRAVINAGIVQKDVVGGRTGRGNSSLNEVAVFNQANIKGEIFGGYVDALGSANQNKAIVNNSVIDKSVLGGRVGSGEASKNEVILDENTRVAKDVFGGYALTSGDANQNRITIKDSSVEIGVYGGYSSNGNASENIITVSKNARLNTLYGGYANSGNANRNIVNLDSDSIVFRGKIYGGNGRGGDKFSGNTLNIRGKNITAENILNFEFINFYIPNDMSTREAMLTLTDNSLKTDLSASKIGVCAVEGVNLRLKDRFTLISSVAGIAYPDDTTNYTGQIQSGISAMYDFKLEKDSEGKKLYAVVSSKGKFLPYPKNILETTIAEMYAVNRGIDLVDIAILKADKNEVFATSTISKARIKSGSYVDVSSFAATAGVIKEVNDKHIGAFLEFGSGKYNSYNDFGDIEIRGKGNLKYYGAGIVSKFELKDNFYLDSSLKLGMINTDYENDLIAAILPRYDATRRYYAIHVGAGRVIWLDEGSNLDIYAKAYYTRLSSKDISIVGDKIKLKASNSLVAKTGARYGYALNKMSYLYAGVAYEREFKGEAKGYNITHNQDIASPSMKGSSILMEIGTSLKFDKQLIMDFGLKTISGKKRGLGAVMNAEWKF